MDKQNKDFELTLEPTAENEELSVSQPSVYGNAQIVEKDDASTSVSAGLMDESMFSEEERRMIDKFAGEIDITNVGQIVNYGSTAQKNISDFSASVLEKVKTRDLGEVGESLKQLTIAIDSTTKEETGGLKGLFKKAKKSTEAIKANYAKAETNVNSIEEDLKSHQLVLTQDIGVYQKMYELNLKYYRELTMYIIAGKKALETAQNVKLPQLKALAEAGREEDMRNYRDYADLCYRFEKKLADLEITRVISIQTAPQIRMLQNNDRELMDKLQSSISNTIPLWRNQLVLSLGIENTRKALEAQNLLSEKTNELLAKNSELLKMATIETARESERPIVELETLQKCNTNLITSINEVIRIHEEGAEKRRQAQTELLRIENELKQALLEAGKRE